MIAPTSVDTNLSQLLEEVSSGKIQLPEFQRSWTWDDNRIQGIIASLSQGYPMGAVMRLQYGNPGYKIQVSAYRRRKWNKRYAGTFGIRRSAALDIYLSGGFF